MNPSMNGVWEDPRVVAGLGPQLELREATLARGATGIGWKVGFGAPASLELMGIDAPLVGHLTDLTVQPSGAAIGTEGWSRPVVEFEVALYIGSDLGPGATPEEARSAVEALGPAIEVANIDLTVEATAVADIVAGNIFHRALVLGGRDAHRAGIDIAGLTARIFVDGTERAATSDLEAITGRYPDVVTTVANTLASAGLSLRAGEVIIAGSVIPPIPAGEGSEFVFALHPFEPISVRC